MAEHPIITALQEQVDCYGRLAKLAESQHECVQQGNMEDLLEVLAKRQEVLDRIASLERTVSPAKRQWSAYSVRLDPETRGRAEQLLGRTRALLEQITSADRNDALVLQQRKLNLGREIQQASAGRQVNRTYAVAAYGGPRSNMDVSR